MTTLVLGTIVQSWNFPGRTQAGIEFDGKHLLIGDNVATRPIHIHNKNAALTHIADVTFPVLTPWFTDMTFDGKRLWIIDTSVPFIAQLNFPPFQAGLPECIKTIPRDQAWGIFGLTFDGKHLITEQSGVISWLNPQTDTYIDQFWQGVPAGPCCFDGKYYWGCDGGNNLIRCYNLASRIQVTTFAFTAPTGIAFDGKYLWIIDTTNVYCVEKS